MTETYQLFADNKRSGLIGSVCKIALIYRNYMTEK